MADVRKLALEQPDLPCARTLGRFLDGKLDALTFAQQLEHGTADRAAVEKVLDAALVSDESETLVDE
jgi:hypothetical protein